MGKSYVGALANKSRFASVVASVLVSVPVSNGPPKNLPSDACKSTSPLGRSKWYSRHVWHGTGHILRSFKSTATAGRGSLLRGMRPAHSRSPPGKRYGSTHRLLLENTLSASERTISLLQAPYGSHTGIGQQQRLCQSMAQRAVSCEGVTSNLEV